MPVRTLSLLALALLGSPLAAVAGMPSADLSDAMKLRFQDISFFLVLLLACGAGMKWLWNFVFKEFAAVPRLGYGKALGLTSLLGVALLLVLSMISGARELLTPGAWRKQGSTYRLNHPSNDEARIRQLMHLRAALWYYAQQHDGKFPLSDWLPEIPEKVWHADEEGTHFIYFGGHTTGSSPETILAAEPSHFGETRYVLTADGALTKLPSGVIRAAMGIEGR